MGTPTEPSSPLTSPLLPLPRPSSPLLEVPSTPWLLHTPTLDIPTSLVLPDTHTPLVLPDTHTPLLTDTPTEDWSPTPMVPLSQLMSPLLLLLRLSSLPPEVLSPHPELLPTPEFHTSPDSHTPDSSLTPTVLLSPSSPLRSRLPELMPLPPSPAHKNQIVC